MADGLSCRLLSRWIAVASVAALVPACRPITGCPPEGRLGLRESTTYHVELRAAAEPADGDAHSSAWPALAANCRGLDGLDVGSSFELDAGAYIPDDNCVLASAIRFSSPLSFATGFGTLFLANSAAITGPLAAADGSCRATWRLAVGETGDGDGVLVGRVMDGIAGCPSLAGVPACADYWRADLTEVTSP